MLKSDWHIISVEESLKILGSNDKTGLSSEEVVLRQKEYGHNKLPEEKPLNKVQIFLRQFKSPLMYILVVAGIITTFLKEYPDSIVIFSIALINALIGFFQENKTSEILTALKKLVKVKSSVIRESEEKRIFQEGLVPGDIFILRPGDKIPADGRIVKSYSLQVNESALTGEWLPARKNEELLSKDTPLADRNNMVYMGTVVQEGKARVVVVATGLKTEIGKVASIVKRTKDEKTPYQEKIENFGKLITIVILLASVLILLAGAIVGENIADIFFMVVAIAVAAIPEGLPIAVTLVFAFSVRELLKKKGLVRQLIAAEILGSTSVICADKTGTLTEAKMEVKGIYTGAGELPGGKIHLSSFKPNSSHMMVLKIALIRSDAFIENLEDPMNQWIVRGEPTEKALVLASVQAGLNKTKILTKEDQIDELIFDSGLRYSASLHNLNNEEYIVYTMGSPESILNLCSFTDLNGEPKSILSTEMKRLKERYSLLAAQGFRLIAMAYKVIPKDRSLNISFEETNIESRQKFYKKILREAVFAGFVTLHDPIRRGVKEAVRTCKKAGMNPIIITGDHKLTAKAIAQELELNAKEDNILEGDDLDKMSDDAFNEVFEKIKIYARVEPRHKIRIVEAWQRKGEIVAMTGDGINDAPALKKANIGVALGSGTDVAKEASDLILLDDNFEVIVVAVEEGRRIIDNIRKVLTYLLMGSFTEIILIGTALFFRLPLPVLPGQILWKNVIEDTPPSFALTLEPKEKDIMNRPPEPPNLSLLTKQMKFLILAVGILTDLVLVGIFAWFLNQGYPIEETRTVIFAGLIIGSFFSVFSLRNLRQNIWQYNPFANLYVLVTVITGMMLLIFAIYSPFSHFLLKTVPIGIFEWSILIGFGILHIILIELTKLFFRARKSI